MSHLYALCVQQALSPLCFVCTVAYDHLFYLCGQQAMIISVLFVYSRP